MNQSTKEKEGFFSTLLLGAFFVALVVLWGMDQPQAEPKPIQQSIQPIKLVK